MTGDRSLFAGFVLLVGLVAGMFLADRSHVADLGRYEEAVVVFRRVGELESDMERSMLLLRGGHTSHYDDMVTLVGDLRRERRRLESAVHRGPSDILPLLRRYSQASEERIAILERIKARKALIANSLTYLPVVERDLRDDPGASGDLRRLAEEVLHRVVVFAAGSDARSRFELEDSLARLFAAVGEAREESAASSVLRHGRVVMEEFQALLADVDSFLQGRPNALLDAIGQSHQRHLRHRMDGEETIRQGLILLSALLVIGMGYTFLSLRRARQAEARGRGRMLDAIENFAEGFALFDAQDRLLMWNDKLLQFFPGGRAALSGAPTFETFMRAAVGAGDILVGEDGTESWMQERLRRHRNPSGMIEICKRDGRTVEIRERRTAEGGVVVTYADVSERVAIAEKLKRHRADLERAQELAHMGSWSYDLATAEFSWSPGLYRIFGRDAATFHPTPEAVLESVHPFDRQRVREDLERQVVSPGTHTAEYRILRPDGTLCYLRSVREVLADANGKPVMITGIAQDITGRRRSEETLDRLFQAIEQSPVSVVITDAHGNIEYVNPAFVRVTGYTPLDVIGANPRVLKSGYNSPLVYKELWETILAGREWRGELHNRRKNGALFWESVSISPIKDPDGAITHFLAIKEDITQRKAIEDKLLRQANFDDLTDLPNRVLAMDRLSQALAQGSRERRLVAVMVVNLDDLKKINNTLGLAAGDTLLVEASRRLAACVRDGDTIARLEGDQFLIVLPDLTLTVFAEVVAQKLLAVCNRPFVLDGQEVLVTARLGLTISPTDGSDPQVLLRNAQAAVSRAKEIGGNTYRFFTPRMNEVAIRRLAEENLLRQALDRNEMYLVYQPLIETGTGRVVAAEALLRWNNPQLGLVPPDQFIATAEKTGIIVPVGEWVLRRACRTAKDWNDQTGRSVRIAVNVSFRQFKGGTLVDIVARALEETGLPAECLELEITERVLIEDDPETGVILNTLHEMGVRLSMDDFGTGYSSLSYLKKFPFDTIKVDRSFVRDVNDDPDDAALASAIIAMGHSLGLRIIAEGVETPAQLQFLKERGCHIIQGYYLSRPLAEVDFASFLRRSDG
ncbi:MAG: EAL domain-containing protein [Magnetospirillum sp. WYHS-4]